MKHLSLLLCATLLAVAAPVPSVNAQAAVSIDFFYDALNPYGDWIYTSDYGYVWEPTLARQHHDWSPYSDGYWAYTDAGWTWISNEDFGWATYHYGRWLRMFGRWVWIPGHEWAPAWVSWRQTHVYIGWAPLPPEARWHVNTGFHWWTDSYYDIGPAYYSFVPMRSFATRSSLRPLIVDRRRNVVFIDQSVNITNISYRQNVVNHIFVGGPDPAHIDRLSENRVRRLTLRRDDDSFRRDWFNNPGERPRGFHSLSRIENDQLVVAAPAVKKEAAPALPPRVRERFDRPEIDRGWGGVSDANAAERLRERQRQELAKAKTEKLPEKAPLVATSNTPPPAVGRTLKPEERWGSVKRPDPRHVDEEVRKAVPKPEATKPGVVEEPPTPSGTRRPDAPAAEARPGLGPNGRPDLRPDGRPGRGPDGRPDSEDRTSPVKPGEVPRPQVAPPGGTPGDDGNRRRGGVPGAADPRQPTVPQVTPPLPGQREGRPGLSPESRRPVAPDVPPNSPPQVRPVPMPEPPNEPQSRPRPMPVPEAPRANPVPMPQPSQPPEIRPPTPQRRPEAPQRIAPPVIPTPTQPRAAPPTPVPQPTAPPEAKKPEGKRQR